MAEEKRSFYRGRRVLITGHTGFKGSWLSRILILAGAQVTGYSLDPPTDPALFSLLDLGREMTDVRGDVRDLERLRRVFAETEPEVVFHLAAQPIVRESYRDPVGTYAVNVMGTVHVLECVRHTPSVRSLVNVTTDKVYETREWEYGYRETDRLDGYDPYSNSKSCSELVTHSYRQSFFGEDGCAVSTCRAGNVIGGGDFAVDRILPDCIRAASAGRPVKLRNPGSVRPYQHVLEPLSLYLKVAAAQYGDRRFCGNYNVGPDDCDCVTTGELAELFCRAWGGGASWVGKSDGGPHEANFLRLDCSRVKSVFGWRPRRHVKEAVEMTAEWFRALPDGFLSGSGDPAALREAACAAARAVTDRQIREFFAE